MAIGLTVLSLSAAGAGAGLAAGHSAKAQLRLATAAVPCWNDGSPRDHSRPDLWIKPRRCTFYERGEPDQVAVKAKRIRWKRWGPHKAVGRGLAVTDVVGNTPIKIRLTRPGSSCEGGRTFSKGKFIAPELDRKNGIRLFSC